MQEIFYLDNYTAATGSRVGNGFGEYDGNIKCFVGIAASAKGRVCCGFTGNAYGYGISDSVGRKGGCQVGFIGNFHISDISNAVTELEDTFFIDILYIVGGCDIQTGIYAISKGCVVPQCRVFKGFVIGGCDAFGLHTQSGSAGNIALFDELLRNGQCS